MLGFLYKRKFFSETFLNSSYWIPGKYPSLFEASLEFEVQYPQIGRMITLPQLLDNAKCFETVRTLALLE